MMKKAYIIEVLLILTSASFAIFANAFDIPIYIRRSAVVGVPACMVISVVLILLKSRTEQPSKPKQTPSFYNVRGEPISRRKRKPIPFIYDANGEIIYLQKKRFPAVVNVNGILAPRTLRTAILLAFGIFCIVQIVLSISFFTLTPPTFDPQTLLQKYCNALQRQDYHEIYTHFAKPPITIAGIANIGEDEYINQARAADNQFGKVTNCTPLNLTHQSQVTVVDNPLSIVGDKHRRLMDYILKQVLILHRFQIHGNCG